MSPLEKIALIAATARYEPDPRMGLAQLAAAVIDLVNEGPHGSEQDPPAPLPPIEG